METTNTRRLQLGTHYIFNIKRPVEEKVIAIKIKQMDLI